MRPIAGIVSGNKARFLGLVKPCSKEKCPIKGRCGFAIKHDNGEWEFLSEICKVIHQYVSTIYLDWVNEKHGIGDILTQIQLDRIGVHLMPLYIQLAWFSMESAALESSTYKTKHGHTVAYPHFAEIRAINREIRSELKDLGIEKMWEQKFGNKNVPGSKTPKFDQMKYGDPNYHDEISE